jgi:heme exporter protein D
MTIGAVQSFLFMGGYAAYVWPALAITAAVLVGLLVQTLCNLRTCETDLAALQQDLPNLPVQAEDQ